MLQVHLHIHTIIMTMLSVIIRLSVVSEKGLLSRCNITRLVADVLRKLRVYLQIKVHVMCSNAEVTLEFANVHVGYNVQQLVF